MVGFFLLFFRIIQPHTIGNVIIHQCLNDIIRCKDQPGNIIIITIVQIFLCSGNHSVRYSSPELCTLGTGNILVHGDNGMIEYIMGYFTAHHCI